MSTPILSRHEVTISQHPGGHLQVACSGCGFNTTRSNEAGAEVVRSRHDALNPKQFGGGPPHPGHNHLRP